MSASTHTLDGLPMRCPMCGRTSAVWPVLPVGDSICPSCGCLLWFRDYFQRIAAIWPDDISRDTSFKELGAASLDISAAYHSEKNKADTRRRNARVVRFCSGFFGPQAANRRTLQRTLPLQLAPTDDAFCILTLTQTIPSGEHNDDPTQTHHRIRSVHNPHR